MKKEHFEILLEEIRHNFKVGLEGHSILRNEIKRVNDNLAERADTTDALLKTSVKDLHKKIDEVKIELKSDIAAVKIELKKDIVEIKPRIEKLEEAVL